MKFLGIEPFHKIKLIEAQLHSMEFPEADAAGYKDFIYDERSWWNTYDVEAHFSKFEIMKIFDFENNFDF